MASLENRTGYWAISFRYGGKKFNRSLKTKSKRAANELKKTVEATIWKIEQGLLAMPDDADVVSFLTSSGNAVEQPKAPDTIPLKQLFADYTEAVATSLEETTVYTIGVHTRHLIRILGDRFDARTVRLSDLDNYVATRSKEKTTRGSYVTPTTIRKEIGTLSSIWTWASDRYPVANFPNTRKLNYGKVPEKPPFQTWDEIEQQIGRGGLTDKQQAELWDCLFLSLKEISELLAHVRENARQAFVHPMIVTAAHTGARRSELIRAQVNDLQDDTLLIRERKRVKGKYSTRRVPLSTELQGTLRDWLDDHPGGNTMFCQSKADGPVALTKDQAHDHFKRTFADSKWEVLRGWHVLRHSFISNGRDCHAAGGS